MTQLPVRPAPFEPVRSYDAPQVLLSQALDGELTKSGAIKTLFGSEQLSPAERETFVTRLKERLGRNSFSDAIVDVATNPFVWMMFVFSPVGGAALKQGSRSIFEAAEPFGAFVMEHAPVLAPLLSPFQHFTNTAISPALMAVTAGMKAVDRESAEVVTPALERLIPQLQKRGFKGIKTSRHLINPETISHAPSKAKAMQINDDLHAYLEGWDKDRVEAVAQLTEKGKDLGVEIVEKDLPRFVNQNLEEVLRKDGTLELANGLRTAMNKRAVRLFGDEAKFRSTGEMVVDSDKMLRMWRGLQMNPLGNGHISHGDRGESVVRTLMGERMVKLIQEGKVSEKQFEGMVRTSGKVAFRNLETFVPHNLRETVDGLGSSANLLKLGREGQRVVATGSAIGRVGQVEKLWNPNDLNRIRQRFGEGGVTQEFKDFVVRQDDALKKVGADTTTRFNISGMKSVNRYLDDTARTYVMYGQKADDFLAVREAQRLFNKQIGTGHGRGAQVAREGVERLAAERAKLIASKQHGGDSLADVLLEQYTGLPQIPNATGGLKPGYAAEALSHTILPKILGTGGGLQHSAAVSALTSGKHAMFNVLNSGVGKAMRESGPIGKKTFNKLMEVATTESPIGLGRGVQAEVARYLYVTHLGLNMGSVAMNLGQPWLLAATWLGAGPVFKGYKEGFKELFGYMGERAAEGFKRLTQAERAARIDKHFKFANVDGKDLLGIGKDSFENIDAVGLGQGSRLSFVGKQPFFREALLQWPMKVFEKAEVLNRSVTAHAVEEVHRRAGRQIAQGVDRANMLFDVERFVGETQFGGSILNTPLIFLRGPGENPLLRQFLQFPLRSATGLLFQSSRLGKRDFASALATDVIRGMGISAVIYETSKNLLGADPSRGLFASASTELIGGQRSFQNEELLSIPPIIDIPFDLMRGVVTDDAELLQQTVPRLVPGGIALSRAIGITKKLPESPFFGLPHSLQKTYIDPTQKSKDGLVPVFRGDGTVDSFQDRATIVAKGLGVDLGRFKSIQEFNRFLVSNREQIVGARREVLAAYLANNIQKGNQIRKEFERRFQMPLTITREQLRGAIRLRQAPKTERILQRIDTRMRPEFARIAASKAQNLGLTPEELLSGPTTASRQVDRNVGPTLDPQTIEKLRQVVAETDQPQGESFAPYGGFKGGG